jgi:hypothetical protein
VDAEHALGQVVEVGGLAHEPGAAGGDRLGRGLHALARREDDGPDRPVDAFDAAGEVDPGAIGKGVVEDGDVGVDVEDERVALGHRRGGSDDLDAVGPAERHADRFADHGVVIDDDHPAGLRTGSDPHAARSRPHTHEGIRVRRHQTGSLPTAVRSAHGRRPGPPCPARARARGRQ